jgi:SAM-dependent methyltransferase
VNTDIATRAKLPADGPNAAMIEHWNDVVGAGWVAGQEAIDAHLAPLGELAIERAAPRPGERVLDVGCGCGATALALAERVGGAGQVIGVDVSLPMLARAEERARSAGLRNVRFVNADAQTHRSEPAFDLVFSRFGVMFFRDFAAAFANLRRALVPGGRIVFVCWRELERNDWMAVPMAAVRRHVEVPAPPKPGEPGPYGLADAASVRGWLAEAGFAGIEIAPLHLELSVGGGAGLEGAADFLTSMGPVAAALRGVDEAQRAPVRSAVRDALRPYQTDRGVLLGASAWLVSALSPLRPAPR